MPKPKMRGVHVPHFKNTAELSSVRMPTPQKVTIPLSMHIGAPAKSVVMPGDHVDVGQLIAEAAGAVSAPIHASVSGTVKKSSEYLAPNGRNFEAIVIESDGLMTVSESVRPPEVHDYDSFIKAVRDSGVVGLGGAGFPTSVKLNVGDVSRIEEIIINGAECEPYITSDTRTMIEKSELIARGIKTLETYLSAKKIIVAVEKNKPKAIAEMKRVTADDGAAEVKVLPSVYPQGGEKVLIYNVTGKVTPEGKLPIDVGVIVINCTTLAALQEYLETGMPLVSKCVTVDGKAVKEPKNVIVPIGTSVSDVFEFCGGFSEEPEKVLYGGLMMGICIYSLDYPILKNTNAILALNKKEAAPPAQTACIRCGNCIRHCPFSLNPPAISAAREANDCEALAKLKINICMECGCCAFICPAGRPLVTSNKLAKALLAEHNAKQKGKA